MSTYDIETLKDFFAGYFHEDWNCDAENTTQVVQNWLRDFSFSPARAAEMRAAIIAYVENEPDDEVLEKKLFTELGAYYLPSADGLTARAWLLSVADMLATKT